MGKLGAQSAGIGEGETFVYIGTDDGDFALEPSIDDLVPTLSFTPESSDDEPETMIRPVPEPSARREITVVRLMTPRRSGEVEKTHIGPCPGARSRDRKRPASNRFLPEGKVTTRPPRSFQRRDPDKIGNYRVLRRIAAGGMGIVYEAEHEGLGRHVAIKVLRKSVLSDAELVRRFLGEAIAAARIRHSGVVTVYDFGHLPDGTTYLVMEYLEGQTLLKAMNSGEAMTIERVVELGRQIATTLAHAHQAGIVHRDLKPDNIYLVRDPHTGAERTKVLDFGVAKFVQQQLLTSMQTQMGKILGTPWYMPPEQCQGTGDIDERSDVYSLGCVMFHMACGRVPFPGKLTEVLAAHRQSAPPSPRKMNPAIPRSLERLILSMIAKDPRRRPQSMAQVERALRKLDLTAEERDSLATQSVPPMAMPRTLARGSGDRLVVPLPAPVPEPEPSPPKFRWGLALAILAAVGTIVGTGAYYL